MYVSILTGRVSRENWLPLQHSFDKEVAKRPPHGLMESFLIQSEDEPANWQVVSVWATKADFKEFEPTEQAAVLVELLCHEGVAPHRHGYVTVTHYERV